jgi:hypothetical protein
LSDQTWYKARLIATIPLRSPQSSSLEDTLLEQLALQDWQACINHSEEIVSTFQYWHPSYFALVDPMISTILWFNCCLLSLHTMHHSGESSLPAAESARLESALDPLTVSLQRFSEHWSIANLLLGKLFSPPPPPILSLVSDESNYNCEIQNQSRSCVSGHGSGLASLAFSSSFLAFKHLLIRTTKTRPRSAHIPSSIRSTRIAHPPTCRF